MVQKYQNEILPIFYYGISTKTNEKDLKISNLQPPDWKSPNWMSLYLMGGESGGSAFNKEKTLIGTFFGHCESPVDSSSVLQFSYPQLSVYLNVD